MMGYEIKSYVGVGKIEFGMNESEIFAICGNDFDKYENQFTEGFKLSWNGHGINILCDGSGCCKAVEGGRTANITYKGEILTGKPYKDVKEYLLQYGKDIVEDGDGCTFYDLGIGLYVPTIKDGEQEEVEGVIAFVKGYYD